jgi:hypothetical protein
MRLPYLLCPISCCPGEPVSFNLWNIDSIIPATIALHVGWGGPSWIPVPADYDGDGKADIAVYNPIGVWSSMRSSDGENTVMDSGGAAQDVPNSFRSLHFACGMIGL